MIKKSIQKVYLALIFILLYAPIVTLMVLSFNESRTRAKWGGFTLKWYQELFKNEQIMSAFYTTLVIAFLAAAAATVIGTAVNFGCLPITTVTIPFLTGGGTAAIVYSILIGLLLLNAYCQNKKSIVS